MDDYEIKMEGEFHTFEGGAIRYTKTGKGRPDLIPTKTMMDFLAHVDNDIRRCAKHNSDMLSVFGAMYVCSYFNAVMQLTMRFYNIENDVEKSVAYMLLELSKHFEKGAEKYGEHNCEKGIPLESFVQSGMRHTLQAFAGNDDENHPIAAIWNFFMAAYTYDKTINKTNVSYESTDINPNI